MGCFQSKKEVSDLHPNVFRVVNIDENGSDLCTGQLEITDTDIILYREGRGSTIWPLHSLRRYGFEGEIFSFESGRRCETGEGIYAFKCRRASLLFQTLQHQIQLRNVVHDTVPYPVSRLTPSPQGRQTLQASVVHRSSLDNGQPENIGSSFNNNLSNIATPGLPVLTQSPPSPSSADILEVTPLYPRSQGTSNHVANVYEVRDFKREHNNNQTESNLDNRHVYTNDFNRDLAMLRKTLKQENALNTIKDIDDETYFIENRCINENNPNSSISPLSPTMSNSSEHYAQLSIEQQQEQKQEQQASRLYVNIPPNDLNVFDANKSVTIPNTPLTPKQVEYCNFLIGTKAEINSYANLMLGEKTDSNISNKSFVNKSDQQKSNQKFSESDTTVSLSPIEDIEVNYAVLDMDTNKESTKAAREAGSPDTSSKHEGTASCSYQLRGRVVSQASTDHATPAPPAAIGYTTIDFDKTVALTSVAAGAESNLDGCRKIRHNSCGILCGSPGTTDKTRGNN